jgi:branched-chain amino acid transport system permease protein
MDWGDILSGTLRASVGEQAIIYALAAIGLNIHFGYTGLLNFGQIGFMAVGAYGVAVSVRTWDWPFWAGLAFGIAGAVALALLLGIPTLRLRADYLAIVTIAASEIFRRLMGATRFRATTGGADGVTGYNGTFRDLNFIPDGDYGFGPWRYTSGELWELVVGWTLVLLAVGLTYLLIRSPWGRVIKAIREDEDAARALGKNAYWYKMQSLVLGGVIGAFGGMFWALAQGNVSANNFNPEPTFFAYVALILGGTARIWGPVIGSMIFWAIITFTNEALRSGIRADYVPDWMMDRTQVGTVRLMLVGVALILLMVFRPQGIFGDKREIALEAR